MLSNKNPAARSARHFLGVMALIGSTALVACSPIRHYDLNIPEPDPSLAKGDLTEAQAAAEAKAATVNSASRFSEPPSVPTSRRVTLAQVDADTLQFEGEPVTLNIEGLPIPAFINEVFGNLLGLSYNLSPQLQKKTDLVTLRITDPVSLQKLYSAAQKVLESYGVVAIREDGILQFLAAQNAASVVPPLIVSGEALPNVPATHRPVFYYVELKVVQAQRARGWLAQAFEGQKIKFNADPETNALWLQGGLDVVKEALAVVKLVDQPLMRGRNSLRIEPRYLRADKLSTRLQEMLKAQGYYATGSAGGAATFFTIEETNSIIAFVADPNMLPLIKSWVEELDRPLQQVKGNNIFYYEVRNTSARGIAETLNMLDASGAGQGSGSTDSTGSSGSSSGSSVKDSRAKGRLVVDSGRNALLFHGGTDEWNTLLPAIEHLDKEPLQVLVEVVIAEVQLTDKFSFGIEWAINNTSLGGQLFDAALGEGVTMGQNGISYYPISGSGSTRAILSALATESDAKILQTPRLLVRSGEEASINVGFEVPIVTQQANSGPQSGGDSALVQSVSYRSTGNSLSIKPIVFAGGQVDLQVKQEVSSADVTTTSDLDSPTIATRNIATTLTIRDGGSVLIGGIINTSDTQAETKVPFFGDIPFLGKWLFTQTENNTSKTELMVLIVPYVISGHKDAESVTEAFRRELSPEYFQ